MTLKKYLYIAMLLTTGLVCGQDYKSRIYNSYLNSQMGIWKEVMEEMESAYTQCPDMDLLYDLLEAEYGYTGYCISMNERKEARRVHNKALDHLHLLLEHKLDNPRVYCLQGAFYGFGVFLEPTKAVKNKRRSVEANRRALKLGPQEPQAWMEAANIKYFTPAIFGGSKKGAVPLYEKAVRLYESSAGRTHQNWVYLNCLAGLGTAYEKTGQIHKAGEVYRKLLKLEPSFSWIKDDRYPQFLQKHSMN